MERIEALRGAVVGLDTAPAYYPKPNPNEEFRKISVEITADVGKKYRVRSRPGYRPRGAF